MAALQRHEPHIGAADVVHVALAVQLFGDRGAEAEGEDLVSAIINEDGGTSGTA